MSADEVRLAKEWFAREELPPSAIAARLGRHKSTVIRALGKKSGAPETRGRPAALGGGQVDRLVGLLKKLIQKSKGEYEVTLAMLKRSARCKASERSIARALHSRGVYFRRMRQKPILTDQDRKDRQAFARARRHKPASWWRTHVHMHIDVKHFPVYLNGDARHVAAQQRTRGAYRTVGDGLGQDYVRRGSKLKYNTGAKGVGILAGVGDGKLLIWERIEGTWNADTAARLYTGPILAALRKAHPGKRSFTILEDNDPSGFKSRKGMDAKREAGIDTLDLPKRSPDLNVCDYALWHEVNTRLRRQEDGWPKTRRETRPAYLRRLRRAALGIPAQFLTKAVESMRHRCELLDAAEGGLFAEGR